MLFKILGGLGIIVLVVVVWSLTLCTGAIGVLALIGKMAEEVGPEEFANKFNYSKEVSLAIKPYLEAFLNKINKEVED